MTTETNHSTRNHIDNQADWPVGWVEQLALRLIAQYRSEETTLGRAGWGHTGVATRAAGSLQSGVPLHRALAESVGIRPGSREAVQAASLLLLGGALELVIRRYPSLARSGAVVGLLVLIANASHGDSEEYVNSPPKQNDEQKKERKKIPCDMCNERGWIESDTADDPPWCPKCHGKRWVYKYIGDGT